MTTSSKLSPTFALLVIVVPSPHWKLTVTLKIHETTLVPIKQASRYVQIKECVVHVTS